MNFKINLLTLLLFFCLYNNSFAQTSPPDTIRQRDAYTLATSSKKKEQSYQVGGDRLLIYPKPKPFSFLTSLPHDAVGLITTPFKKKNIKPLIFIAGSTALLMLIDQPVTDGFQQFSRNIHFKTDEQYRDIINLRLGKKDVSLLKAPKNINTALYQIGQGFPSLIIGAGLFMYGKIHNNYRALSTASQLAETFILMGVSTQILKRITGRQSPSNAIDDKGGDWHFLPSFRKFQNNTPNYDAFPSGHLATLMSTVTILAGNYPEKRYIKPLGYSITCLVGLAMINNNVHWISDYPLAIGLGYLCARQVMRHSRKIETSSVFKKKKADLSYTFNILNGRFIPGIVYRF